MIDSMNMIPWILHIDLLSVIDMHSIICLIYSVKGIHCLLGYLAHDEFYIFLYRSRKLAWCGISVGRAIRDGVSLFDLWFFLELIQDFYFKCWLCQTIIFLLDTEFWFVIWTKVWLLNIKKFI